MGWRGLFPGDWQERTTIERQVREEMEAHLERLVGELREAGASEEEARERARARFGEIEEHYRRGRRIRVRSARSSRRRERVSGLLHDVRAAWRSLRARPGFALAAALMLGLGIGAATVLSSLVETVLLRPLPFEAPERLVHLKGAPLTAAPGSGPFPPADELLAWRSRLERSFSDVAAYHPMPYSVNLSGLGAPAEAGLTEVTDNFFTVLGQRMILGRAFGAADREGGSRPAVIGERVWRRHWSADPDVVGREVLIDGRAHRILGVVPAAAQLPAAIDVWVPMGHSWEEAFILGARYFFQVARIRPGVEMATVAADVRELESYLGSLRDEGPEIRVSPLHGDLVAGARSPLWLLLGGIGLLLTIALANLASYMLVGSRAREAEYAVRSALGAARRRLLQQSLLESSLLALAGFLVAALLASWSVGLIRGSQLPLPRLESLTVDWRLFAIALGISGLCALLSGIAPALYSSRPDLSSALAVSARGAGDGSSRTRELLVVGQIALAVVLAAGAVLLVRSYSELLSVDNGFRGDALTFAARLDEATFPEPEQAQAFARTLVERLEALPGVEAAGASTLLPLAERNNFGLRYVVEGGLEVESDHRFAFFSASTPGYLEALGVRVLAGRRFDRADAAGERVVALVNETFLRTYFGAVDPSVAIGRRVWEGSRDGAPYEIVGVVGDVHRSGPAGETHPEIYFPLSQRRHRPEFYAVHWTGVPGPVVAAAREIATELAPSVPLHDMRLMRERLRGELTQPRLLAWLFTAFGLASMSLAAFGLYAVVAYWISARDHEIGVRLALGATRRRVFGRLLGVGALRLGVGLGMGLVAYTALARVVDTELLFGVGIHDPASLGAVVGILACATLAAIAVAAGRVLRMDPASSLREA